MTRRKAPSAQVLNLHEARLSRRLSVYGERLDRALRSNRRAIGKLYVSGVLFTKQGTRAGRDLLLAHEHLLRVVSLLNRLRHEGDVPAPRKASEVDAVFAELDTLLERTGELTEQTAALLDGLKS